MAFAGDSFHVDGWREFIGADAEALGRGERSAWASFARSGDPSASELAPWPRCELDKRLTMVLSASPTVVHDALQRERSMWRPTGLGDSQ